MCLKVSCFPDCWKVYVVPLFKNVGERTSQSTADLLAIISDRIARASNSSGATRAVALDISKALDRVQHAGLLHKLTSYGISGQIFGLISFFHSNRWLRWFWMGRLHSNS